MDNLNEIIENGRGAALKMLNGEMLRCFESISDSMKRWKEATGEVLTDKNRCGLSARTLKQIEECSSEQLAGQSSGQIAGQFRRQLSEQSSGQLSGQIPGQLSERLSELTNGPDRSRLLMEFLGINSLRMKEFRAKYPNSYAKWDAEADARLLAERRAGASLARLAADFGRNVNAVKIRLERLGAGDAETSDATLRYPSGRSGRKTVDSEGKGNREGDADVKASPHAEVRREDSSQTKAKTKVEGVDSDKDFAEDDGLWW